MSENRYWHAFCYVLGVLEQTILFCILSGDRAAGQRIEQLVKKLRGRTSVQVVRQLDDVKAMLVYRPCNAIVTVLFAGTRKDLLDFSSIWSLLHDMRTILVLPDAQEETIAIAHTMRPRFITSGDRDLRDLEAVLEKMTGIGMETETGRREYGKPPERA